MDTTNTARLGLSHTVSMWVAEVKCSRTHIAAFHNLSGVTHTSTPALETDLLISHRDVQAQLTGLGSDIGYKPGLSP